MMYMMNGYGSCWWIIIMIIFWTGLLILGIYLIKSFINGGRRQTSIRIIKERLAKGEIDKEEYEQLKTTLERDKK